MTTLIAVYNSEGCVGRCDAKCYNAVHPDCQCVCGSANHGAGLQRAMDNTRAMAEEWVDRYARERNLSEYRAEVPAVAPVQRPLFA